MIKSIPANQAQRAYLESLIKRCRNIQSKLIVEDLSSVNNEGKGMCCNFAINAHGGILGKLADSARMQSVDVDNVEFRFCRVAGIGPLLNNPQSRPSEFVSATSIGMDALYKEIVDELERIARYDDGKQVNDLYKPLIAHVKKSLHQLKIDRVIKQSIAQYCASVFKNNYVKHLEKLCIFDSPLIDIKIMHSIVSTPEKSIIIVAAGGSHIEKMKLFSSSRIILYKKIMPQYFYQHKNIDNALGAGHKNDMHARPPAVDLKVLDEIILYKGKINENI